eukprot:scaffold384_cov238-Pinguiococcus_pyrenoidosus.AAC.1
MQGIACEEASQLEVGRPRFGPDASEDATDPRRDRRDACSLQPKKSPDYSKMSQEQKHKHIPERPEAHQGHQGRPRGAFRGHDTIHKAVLDEGVDYDSLHHRSLECIREWKAAECEQAPRREVSPEQAAWRPRVYSAAT